MEEIKINKTNRGFGIGEFTDSKGEKCSIQESSIAEYPAIWLGVDNADPKLFIQNKGWEKVAFPKETLFNTRMHLNQEQATIIIRILNRFIKTGRIIKQSDKSLGEDFSEIFVRYIGVEKPVEYIVSRSDAENLNLHLIDDGYVSVHTYDFAGNKLGAINIFKHAIAEIFIPEGEL